MTQKMIRRDYARRVGMLALVALMAGLTVVALPITSELESAQASEAEGGDFVPLSPAHRLVYTAASPAQPFTSTDSTRSYQVLGVGGVPASNVRAVSASIAVTGTSTTGYATLWASGTTRPGLPNLMFQPETTPDSNTAMVAVGSDGKISVSIRQATATATNITLDITGYVTATPSESGGGFVPVTPTRLLSTANNFGQLTDPLPPSGSAEIDLSGVPGKPADAAAAFININATAGQDGVLKINLPSDSSSALAPQARYAANQPSSTGLIARLDSGGHLRITNMSTTTSVDLSLDVQGFFTENSSDPSGGFTPVTYRLLDTGSAGIPAQGTLDLQVTDRGEIPDGGVAAAALNVTVVNPASQGFVKLWRTDEPIPPTSNLSFGAGQDQTNLSMVELDDDGKISIYNGAGSAVRVVVDAQGWVAIPEYEEVAADSEGEGQGVAPEPEGWSQSIEGQQNEALVDLQDSYIARASETDPANVPALDAEVAADQEQVEELLGQEALEDNPEPTAEYQIPPDGAPTTGTAATAPSSYFLLVYHKTQNNAYYCGPASVVMGLKAMGAPKVSKYNSSHILYQSTVAKTEYLATKTTGENKGTYLGYVPRTYNRWANRTVTWTKGPSESTLKSILRTSIGVKHKAAIYGTREYANTSTNSYPHYNFHYKTFEVQHIIMGYGYKDDADIVYYADPVAGRWTKEKTGEAEDPHEIRSMYAHSMVVFIAAPFGVVA